jgi:carbonic anhydrase
MYLQLLPLPTALAKPSVTRLSSPLCICQPPSISASAPGETVRRVSSSADANGYPSPDRYHATLANNKGWASKTAREHPDLFPTLATGQHPEILWIGCADSRCPETTILGLQPGDVFVHRNIANIVHYGDLSSAAVIEYAVVYLKVAHIILCGHTACGGVTAALGNQKLGILDPWLMPLRRLREQNIQLLDSLDPKEAVVRLAELNVLQGVRALKENNVVLDAIQDRGLQVHGLIYDVGSGLLSELETHDSNASVESRLTAFKTSQ